MECTAVTTPHVANLKLTRCERIADEISELCSYIYAAEHRLLTLIREFDEQQGWQNLGFHSCAYWLNFKCGMGLNTARERIRVAHALGRLPQIDSRFAAGAVSYSKVRAMTRIANEGNEDYLLMVATHGTAHHVEKLVQKYRRAKRLQDADAANEQYENRQLTYHYDHDGCLVIKGRFPAEQGALIVKALEMAVESRYSENAECDVSAETSEPTPISTRRADSLAEVAETYMNAEPVPNSTADRYQVVVHISNRIENLSDDSDFDACIENGPHVSAETSRRIACDSSVLGIKEGKDGEPLAIGRKTRSIPPAMRRALRIRDEGCRFPGCTNDRFVDGHHIKHWADGGETNLDNLVLLCRHHHHLVHEGGFSCEKNGSGEVVFRDQRRVPLATWAPQPRISDEDIKDWLDREFFDKGIDADTCRSQWYAGERMDWNLAVSNLFQ